MTNAPPSPPADSPEPFSVTSPVATYDERFAALATISYRIAYKMIGSREESRDIAQEAMARAYARWSHVADFAPAWVSRVTTNLALDHLRRHRHPPIDRGRGAPDHALAASERADLVAALRRLPRRQREVIVLRFLADLPETRVAETLGCSTGTVKQHAFRGLTALRSSLHLDPSTLAIDHALKGLS